VPQGSPRKLSLHDPILDRDRDLILPLHRVKVRRIMIPIKHGNHDAEEATQLWHTIILAP
jgi:hypothetical protein